MPTYEYSCGVCDKIYTFTKSITDPDGEYFCNECNIILKRKYYLSGVVFNGSGFYSKDK